MPRNVTLTIMFATLLLAPLAVGGPKTKVALITGGHKFDEPAFTKMFDALPNIAYERLHLEKDAPFLDDISNFPYDVVVLYNMHPTITEAQQRNFLQLLEAGKGLVVLHHAMVAYRTWPEFAKIAGCKYFQKPEEFGGKQWEKSYYKHDVEMTIKVAKEHPITAGLKDFEITDESYGGCWFAKDNKVLLTTDEPTSDGVIAYTRRYANARVATIQLGHDAQAYNNGNFQKLLAQAIHWTAEEGQ